MDISGTIGSGSRTTEAEDEDWLSYLNLDNNELHLDFDQFPIPYSPNQLEPCQSSEGDFILPAVDLTHQPHSNSGRPIQDMCLADSSISKRDRTSSVNGASPISRTSDQPPRKKARKFRFTTSQNDVLETWLACHILYPYPQKNEKEDLAAATGLTVAQIQTWFARTRQRKLRRQNDDLLHPSEAFRALEANRLTAGQPNSGIIQSASRSRGGSSARLSVGPGLSSLAVAPASPQLDISDKEFDSSTWELQRQDSVSVHSYWEPSALNRASKVNWWLDTLPERTADYHSYRALVGEQSPSSTEILQSIGSTNPSSSILERTAASFMLLPPTSMSNLPSAYQCLPVPPRGRDYMSVSCSSLGSNNVLSCPQSSGGSGNMSATSVRTYATSRTSYSFTRRRGRRMLSGRRSPSPRIPRKRHNRFRSSSPNTRDRRSRSLFPEEVDMRRSKSRSPSIKAKNTVPWSKEWKYCCTFCTERFRDRYRWKRHEESRHAPQKSWVCKPVRPVQDRPPLCPLCHFSQEHPEQCLHDMQPCWSKPEIDRTFFRKDNLVQHLEGVHNARAGITSALIDELTEGISCVPYDLACHFCEHKCATWQDRASHIAAHFESGMTMADWKAPEAGSGEMLVMDQIKPYIPRLSRLWETSAKEQVVGFQQRLQLRTPSPIPASHQSHLPRILVEDYSAMQKEPTMQAQVAKSSQAPTVQSTRKFRFKSVKPTKSLKEKLRKIFR